MHLHLLPEFNFFLLADGRGVRFYHDVRVTVYNPRGVVRFLDHFTKFLLGRPELSGVGIYFIRIK